jgi:hypothetical protein
MNFSRRSRRARFWAAVSLRFPFGFLGFRFDFDIAFTLCCRSFVLVLRRRLADSLNHPRVRDRRDGLLDPIDLNLMIPIVARFFTI